MAKSTEKIEKKFITAGKDIGNIDVRLSYRIVELFSEGLYASPNKAIEELVVNAFDAGAQRVQVLLSSDMQQGDATVAVIDDGEGMDEAGLQQHWLIGVSDKRATMRSVGKERQQIGKFGIGKLATYVLAERLTHISKQGEKYYSASMDYEGIDKKVEKEVEAKKPIKIPLRELTEIEAKEALEPWTATPAAKKSGIILFGKGAPKTWTVTIMSSLKPKVHEIRMGHLEWVLRTAMPLRPDFKVWLNENELHPSKEGKGLVKKWLLGKDLTKLPRPAVKSITQSEDKSAHKEKRFGLNVPGLGRVTGYVEAYKDLLTGKSDELGRSHGFFVYVYDRLINVEDGHFGISPDELRHGTFGRFRAVVRMDGLDANLRANREALQEGPKLESARDVLRGIFNAVRPTIDGHLRDEEPGAQLARKLASSPKSLSRSPIVELVRAVIGGKAVAKNLIIPSLSTEKEREAYIKKLEKRAEKADEFISGLTVDYDGSSEDGIAKYDTRNGQLRINAWHPFVATFEEDFSNKSSGQPLQLLAMAEVLAEAHLYALGVDAEQARNFLMTRDRLLRHLANDSGRESAFSIAGSLRDARNNADKLEDRVCAAFRSLGFEVIPVGGSGKPDGIATANLGGGTQFKVSLEAKSTEEDGKIIPNSKVRVSSIARHRDDYKCQHSIVIGPSFATSQGDESALAKEIERDLENTKKIGDPKTITLITIDDLAKLVRLRPLKQVGLSELRKLFDCKLPSESAAWVNSVENKQITKPPYREVIETIEILQKKFSTSVVQYAALRVELSHRTPPIIYTDDVLIELCKALSQMAPGFMYANHQTVELDQSSSNVIATIATAMRDDDSKNYEKRKK